MDSLRNLAVRLLGFIPYGSTESTEIIHRLDLGLELRCFIPYGSTESTEMLDRRMTR